MTIERARSAVQPATPVGFSRRPGRPVVLLLAITVAVLAVLGAPAVAGASSLMWSTPGAIDRQPNPAGAQINGLSCPTVSLCVAVDANGNVLTSTDPTGGASAWETAAVDTNPIESVSCPSASQCYAVDDVGQMLTSSDPTGGEQSWTVGAADPGHKLTSISCSSDGFCAAVDNAGNAYTSSGGGSWTETDIDGDNYLTSVSCAASTFCVAVDRSGNVVTLNEGSWTTTGDIDPGLTSVSCPSISLCVAVDGDGNALVWTSESNTWAEYNVDGNTYLSSVSCSPSADLCAAVDAAGNVLMLEAPGQSPQLVDEKISGFDPGGDLTAAACASDSLCVAGDASGSIASSTDPVSINWDTQPVDFDNPMTGVSCPTTSLCVATDNDGNILASTDPLGTWGIAAQDVSASGVSLRPSGVSCASPSLCVAVDRAGYVLTSTSPTGTWAALPQIDLTPPLTAVSCTSAQLCVAVDYGGNVLTSNSAGSSWSQPARVDPSGHFTAVSCVGQSLSQTLCAAVDDSGYVAMSTDPGSSSSWTTISIDPLNVLTGVSCPNTSLCVAVDNAGNAVTWQQSSNGWSHPTLIDKGGDLTSVSCSSVDLCVATDTDGNIVETSDPTDPSPAWTPTSTPVDGVSALEAVSCASDSLCAAVDAYGNAVVGAPAQILQVSIGGSGSVSIDGTTCASTCSVTVEQGAQLTLTATPASGYTFAGWSGGGCSGTGSCLITITSGATVTATFLATPGPPVVVTSPQPTPIPVTPPATHKPKPPTRAQVRATLAHELAPAGRKATLAAILKGGSYTFGAYDLPEAGTVTLSWYLAPHGHRPILVARGRLRLGAAGRGKLRVKLNANGRRLLAGSSRIRLVARATFKPAGASMIETSHGFALASRKG